MSPSEAEQPDTEAVTLLDGSTAQLVPQDGGWTLLIDGVRQSHVDAAGGPPTLTSVRWMLIALGDGAALRCAHLGGGMLTLPRALAVARPGSSQVVVELEPALVALARDRFGLPDGVSVEIAEARAWLEAREPGLLDALLVDVFVGGRIPPAFGSSEFFAAARRSLAPGGQLVINSVAGPELDYTRRQLAGLRATFGHVGMIVQGSALGGARFGNATLIASDRPLAADRIRSALSGDDSRGALVTDLDPIVGTAAPASDADQLWSPVPRLPQIDEALQLAARLRETVATLRSSTAAARDGADRSGSSGVNGNGARPSRG